MKNHSNPILLCILHESNRSEPLPQLQFILELRDKLMICGDIRTMSRYTSKHKLMSKLKKHKSIVEKVAQVTMF